MEEPGQNQKTIITLVAIILIAVVVVAAVAASPKKPAIAAVSNINTKASSNTTAQTNTGAGSGSTASSNFKDGTYTATGSYEAPGGIEQITVHVTLQNSIVTATSAENDAQDPQSQEYESLFISGYKSQVIGKNIANINLSYVSGASLTPQGFNDAISKIESQAQA